ncbi:MazG nucleotide pyrophosphohydrolase domain-containing protein [Mycoplasmatota bacterium zrk1]
MKDYKISEFQQFVKLRDHNPEYKLEVMLKFVEEVGELANEVRKSSLHGLTPEIKENMKLELYDCLHYIAAVANINEIDLNEAIELKEIINKDKYNR